MCVAAAAGVVGKLPSFVMELLRVEIRDLLCRTCLCFVDEEDCINIEKNMQLLDMYTACTSLVIHPGDDYPKNICASCYQQLQVLNDFRTMCSDTLVRFKDFLRINKIDNVLKEGAAIIDVELTRAITKTTGLKMSDIKGVNNISEDTSKKEVILESLTDNFEKENSEANANANANNVNQKIKNLNKINNKNGLTKQIISHITEIDLENPSSVKDKFTQCKSMKIPHKIVAQTDENVNKLLTKKSNELIKGLENRTVSAVDLVITTENNSHTTTRNNREKKRVRMHHCTHCSRKFRKTARLEAHLQEDHFEGEIIEPQNTSHICNYDGCRRSFVLQTTLVQHIADSHSKDESLKNHMCELCGKRFRSKVFLKRHRFVHMASKEFPFECNECGKRFSKKLNLQYHLNRHAGIKNFVCTFCGIQKTTKAELDTHLNYHTLEKTWSCGQCDKIFNTLGNLKMHARTVHDGARDYACRYCPLRFGKAWTRKYHEMRHTGEKPHLCKLCGRGFIQAVALRSHMKRAHAETG